MQEGLKKRLIGAAVLASLAVIFVPMLVEEPIDKAELVRTPPAPAGKPFESRLLRGEMPPAVVPLPPTRRVPAKAPVSPDSDQRAESGQPLRTGLNAWVVQVGSFSNRDNARKLVAKLRKAGFKAREPDQIELRGQVMYRVQVGPVLEKDRALEMLPRVNKVTGTTGSVLSYP